MYAYTRYGYHAHLSGYQHIRIKLVQNSAIANLLENEISSRSIPST